MKDNKLLIQKFFKGTHDEAGHYRMAFWDQIADEPEERASNHVDAELKVWDCYHQPIAIEFGFDKEVPEEKAGRLEKLDGFIADLVEFRAWLAGVELVEPNPNKPKSAIQLLLEEDKQ